MKKKYIIGVDPGQKGAFVVFKNGKIHRQKVFPMIGKEIDYQELIRFFRRYRKLDASA